MEDKNANAWTRNFFGFFTDRCEFVEKYCQESVEGLILLTSYLDALAGYRFPDAKSNGERFTRFILEYSGDVETWSKVSLTSLYKQLGEEPKEELRSLSSDILTMARIGNFKHHKNSFNPDLDMKTVLQTLNPRIPDQCRNRAEKIVKQATYAGILWRVYRCEAIHEAVAPPDFPPDIWEMSVPFYASGGFMRGEKEVRCVRFCIPLTFVLKTLQHCLSQFESNWNDGSFDFRSLVVPRIAPNTAYPLIVEFPTQQ